MRSPNWLERLDQAFVEAHGRRFRWGQHDCCQFAARCIAAVTGDDKRTLFSPYSTRAEALQLLKETGGMLGLVKRALGEPVHASRAGDGDIVLIDMGRGEQPAVCRGLNSFAPAARELASRSTLAASAAWIVS